MLTTFIISLREFLEVFFIISLFLSLSKKLDLGKQREIFLASFIGIVSSLTIPGFFFFLNRKLLEKFEINFEILEPWLMIFSSFFIVYVVLSLHKVFISQRTKLLSAAQKKLENRFFDFSLFLSIIFLIGREGIEILLFTLTSSLHSQIASNILGLSLGFLVSFLISLCIYLALIKISLGKIFRITEAVIFIIAVLMFIGGLSKLIF